MLDTRTIIHQRRLGRLDFAIDQARALLDAHDANVKRHADPDLYTNDEHTAALDARDAAYTRLQRLDAIRDREHRIEFDRTWFAGWPLTDHA